MVEPAAQIVNGYRLIKLLGKGAFGVTFLVENDSTKERFAMKVLNDLDEDNYDITELEFLRIANHPFIIGYIKDFPYPQDMAGRHCIVLELADGCDLRKKMIALEHQIPEKVVLNWITHVCLGLAKMHFKGLCHRDVKPENILIVGEVDGGIAKLGDFGTVRNFNYDTHLTYKVGTFLYFAPEKITKKYQGGVDVWALGIVLYELLCGGEFPFDYNFEGKTLDEYMIALRSLKLKKMPAHITPECKELVKKMLKKNPEKRPSIFEILQIPLIADKVRMIINECIIGIEISNKVKQQLIHIGINLAPVPQPFQMIEENPSQIEIKQIEEKKEPPPFPASQLSTGPTSVVSKQSASSAQPLQKQLQKLSVQPSNLFKKEMLDKLIDTFNKPIVKKPNHLDKNGQSKMAKFIKQHGWKWSLQQLNSLANSKAQWAVFEGVNRNGWGFLQSGVYYGEKLDGKRHGYGIVYSIDGFFRNPHLFECQWNMDFPTYGRIIIIQDQKWEKQEGTMNRFFNLNGQCSRHDENGYKYEGGWSNGCKDGQGKEIQSDGISGYEGSWRNNQRHGRGRETFPDGGYREGEWESGTSLGEHKYYNKQGELLKSVYFEREVIL